MTRSITLSFLLAATYVLHAQCTDLPLPTNAVVVTTSGTTNPPPGSVWVCGGLDVTLIVDFTTIYVEPGSTVQVIGSYNTGFMKGPGSLSAQCDTCFWEYEPTVTFMPISGSLNMGAPCDPITYDYSQAPSPGCPNVSAVNEVAATDVRLQLAPNPVADRLNVQANGHTLLGITVLDMTGREVLQASAMNASYDVSTLRAGSYIARIRTERGLVSLRFLKE